MSPGWNGSEGVATSEVLHSDEQTEVVLGRGIPKFSLVLNAPKKSVN